MKNLKTLCAVVLLAAITATSCKKDGDNSANFANRSTAAADYSASTLPVSAVSGDITTNTTWDADHVWEISGIVTVRNGATLTIAPGTFIKSSVNTSAANGVLVIGKDGNINATGTATNPIVFTSRNLLDNNAATVGKPGEFGGVIILGNAVINAPGGSKLIEGLPNESKYFYGGNNNADNRGTFQYVRIEYAGYVLAENIEVNGLTLGAVGSGTTVDHVQVSYGLDDGFEFFGGTVSPSYLVALGNDDDQFDFDNGFTGTISFAIALADGNSTHSVSGGVSDSNGIESDNNAPAEDATFGLLPKTHPTLNNFSVIGTRTASVATGLGYRYGYRNRRGSEVTLNNSIITGFNTAFIFDGTTPALSSFTNDAVNSFVSPAVLPAGTYAGITQTSSATANNLTMVQPWFNLAGAPANLNFLGARGAITSTSTNWIASWTKFAY